MSTQKVKTGTQKSNKPFQMEPELFMARLAEQAERYEDVLNFLTPVL